MTNETENKDLRSLKIGNIASEKLEAAKCEVTRVDTGYVEKAKLNKAVFTLKHPKKEELLKLSTATLMRQRKGKREIVSFATWVTTDKAGNLAMDSTLAQVLKFYHAEDLTGMVGKAIETEPGEDGYLTIKAY